MRPESLDHVALWVSERDRIADALAEAAGTHVIDRSDRFTLVGGDARRGKLTLFDAEGPREPGPLLHIALRVRGGSGTLELPDGLRILLVEGESDVPDLDHVALAVPDPFASEPGWRALGFASAPPGPDGSLRLGVADASLELRQGPPAAGGRPLLNHLGLLVASADEHRRASEEAGIPVLDVVDAPNTIAVFVGGPDGVRVEYVEHKPTFSLV